MEPRGADRCYLGGDGTTVINVQRCSAIFPASQSIAVLNYASVLVVEDEAIIALDIALAIRDAGGQIAGIAASVKQALALIDTMPISAAILDANLVDGDITPVAEILLAAGIPIIIQSGVGLPADLIARYPDLPVQTKPCTSENLVAQLALLIAGRQTA